MQPGNDDSFDALVREHQAGLRAFIRALGAQDARVDDRAQVCGTMRIYDVQSARRAIVRLGDYCAAPVPLVATGRTKTKDGRRLFNVRAGAAEIHPAVPAPKESERILFPF